MIQRLRRHAASLIVVVSSTTSMPTIAKECSRPVYQGMQTKALMRFADGPEKYRHRGTIETFAPKHLFQFGTEESNGFSREYLTIDGFPNEGVMSVVMRKNADFTNAMGSGAFLITPDLPMKYYYATNQAGEEAMHRIHLDDTWRLIGCAASESVE